MNTTIPTSEHLQVIRGLTFEKRIIYHSGVGSIYPMAAW